MIDSLFNLLFRCRHRHLTRPMTAYNNPGIPDGANYVACLDCGKQFTYDSQAMKMGKAVLVPAKSGLAALREQRR